MPPSDYYRKAVKSLQLSWTGEHFKSAEEPETCHMESCGNWQKGLNFIHYYHYYFPSVRIKEWLLICGIRGRGRERSGRPNEKVRLGMLSNIGKAEWSQVSSKGNFLSLYCGYIAQLKQFLPEFICLEPPSIKSPYNGNAEISTFAPPSTLSSVYHPAIFLLSTYYCS